MRVSLLPASAVLGLMIAVYPAVSYERSFERLVRDAPAWHDNENGRRPLVARDNSLADPSKDSKPDNESRPAAAIKQFTAPTIQLKGTAQEIGLDGSRLVNLLEAKFLKEFGFLQNGFTFEKPYETWEIGLFQCEVWTVGNNYPIALHVECTGGSMDEPRHWHYATLGYGPKEKILGIVTKALDSIVAEYGTFVRKASVKNDS